MPQNVSIFTSLLITSLIVYIVAEVSTTQMLMKEAFDRGYAVQCIGKKGYYWDCEE